jgi:hypothetical protein
MKPTSDNCSIKIIGIFLLLMLFASFKAVAQAPKYNIRIIVAIVDGGFENSVVTIKKDGVPFRTIDPNKSKYKVELDLNSEFIITYTKMGYISKSVVVDTHIPNGREQEEFAGNDITIELNKQPEDQEITYTQPVGKFKYSNDVQDFDYDKDYNANAKEMQKKAEANPIPKPKPPTPNPRPAYTPPVQPTLGPSKPIPVEVKQPVYTPEPPKKKVVVMTPEVPPKPIIKNKTEKNYQRDRVQVTIITVNINGVNYEYTREAYAWGGTFFYKNGRNITLSCFDKETE